MPSHHDHKSAQHRGVGAQEIHHEGGKDRHKHTQRQKKFESDVAVC